MQIPDSVEKITNSVNPDSFNTLIKPVDIPLDDIVYAIKRALPPKLLADFELGLAYYKTDASNDKVFFKNLLSLISECLVKGIKESDIDADYLDGVSTATKRIFENLTSNIENLYNMLLIFNKQKNFLDVNNITLIILGYAISVIKKVYNRRNQ